MKFNNQLIIGKLSSYSIYFIHAIGIFFVTLGISQSIFMNFFVNRSLYLDEAMLAYSFSERNLFTLTSSPFEWGQIAPIFYLLVVKSITLVFGNTEFTLRILSFFSYIGTLILCYIIAKQIFKLNYPIFCTAFIANIDQILRYSQEFKQYSFETFICLLALYIFYLYKQHVITYRLLLLCFSFFIYCANPVFFVIGAIIICDFFTLILNRNNLYCILKSVCIGILVLIQFIVYYYYWLYIPASDDFMQEWWSKNYIQIKPFLLTTYFHNYYLIKNLFTDQFFPLEFVIIILFCLSFIYGLYKKNIYAIIINFVFILCIFASLFHCLPISSRILLFYSPFLSIAIFNLILKNNLFSILFVIFLIMSITKIQNYYYEESVLRPSNEPNLVINYLSDNIIDNEYLFVYHYAIPVTKYKIGFNNNKIGRTNSDNIIYSSPPPYQSHNNILNEYKIITRIIEQSLLNKDIYIFSTYTFHDNKYFKFRTLLSFFLSHGYLELVFDKKNNPLYFYTPNLKHIKQHVNYRILDITNTNLECTLNLLITNDGKGYIGGTEFDRIFLVSRNRNDIKYPINSRIAPGVSIEVAIKFNWNTEDKSVDIQLSNEGHYYYDELGVEPLYINRPTL